MKISSSPQLIISHSKFLERIIFLDHHPAGPPNEASHRQREANIRNVDFQNAIVCILFSCDIIPPSIYDCAHSYNIPRHIDSSDNDPSPDSFHVNWIKVPAIFDSLFEPDQTPNML